MCHRRAPRRLPGSVHHLRRKANGRRPRGPRLPTRPDPAAPVLLVALKPVLLAINLLASCKPSPQRPCVDHHRANVKNPSIQVSLPSHSDRRYAQQIDFDLHPSLLSPHHCTGIDAHEQRNRCSTSLGRSARSSLLRSERLNSSTNSMRSEDSPRFG